MENVKLLRKVKKMTNAQRQYQQTTRPTLPTISFGDDFDENIESNNQNMPQKDYFSELSDEIILQIFKWISKPYLLRYATVCKRWYRLMADESLWRRYDLANRTVNAEILISLLNRGVKIFGLGRSEFKKSQKRRIVQLENGDSLSELQLQLDYHLHLTIKLEYLDMTNAMIDLKSLNTILKHCKQLKKISLESLETNHQTYIHLSENKKLDTLNLCMCKGISVDSLILMLNHLRQIVNLNIGWTNLDRECIVLLCSHLPNTVERLNISGCRTTLLDSDIENLVKSCPNLIELDLSDAQSITAKSVEYIANNLGKAEYLAFSRCYSVLPSSYLTLSKLSSLIALDLFNILKDKSIDTLKQCIPSLMYVNRYPFSSIARPIVGFRRTSIWGCRIRDAPILT